MTAQVRSILALLAVAKGVLMAFGALDRGPNESAEWGPATNAELRSRL